MSGVLLYCIAPAGFAPQNMLEGVGRARVRAIDVDGLTAWVTTADRAPDVHIDAVRAHHAVVEASITDDVTTLPVRFGQWLESENVLRTRLLASRAEHQKALGLVQGALEFGVRVIPLEMAAQSAGGHLETGSSGREYMGQLVTRANEKRAHARRGEEIAAELRSAVGTHMVQERSEPLDPDAGLVSIAHLVRRPDFTAYKAALQTVSSRHADTRFHLSGPWPPYSFTT